MSHFVLKLKCDLDYSLGDFLFNYRYATRPSFFNFYILNVNWLITIVLVLICHLIFNAIIVNLANFKFYCKYLIQNLLWVLGNIVASAGFNFFIYLKWRWTCVNIWIYVGFFESNVKTIPSCFNHCYVIENMLILSSSVNTIKSWSFVASPKITHQHQILVYKLTTRIFLAYNKANMES